MTLWVVMCNAMGAKDAYAVFTSREKADTYLCEHEVVGGLVEEREVYGDYSPPRAVYAASRYRRQGDVHEFVGLYSSSEAADAAAGEHGLVLLRVPDQVVGSPR